MTKVSAQSRVDRESGTGGPDPPKNIGFICITSPDPLKNKKNTKAAFNVGPSSAPSETPFDDGPFKVVFGSHPLIN